MTLSRFVLAAQARWVFFPLIWGCAVAHAASEPPGAEPADWRFDGQVTNVTQGHPGFRAKYSGQNSLEPRGRTEETTDVTVFLGRRLGPATELWVNAEVDQGFGLSNTLGAAGFPSGEAYKIGQNAPYLRLPRAFVRHTLSLGGEKEAVEGAANQFAMSRSSDNVVLTAGKFSVVDIFDTNSYAHDPRADFLNWAVIDAGAFDYAADAWGYTFGAAAEWSHAVWTLRGGVFQMSQVPNGKVAGLHPQQHMWVVEGERRHTWNGHPGKIKLLGFLDHARMGRYADALALPQASAAPPDVSLVRRVRSRLGASLNIEQELAPAVGAFLRVSANDGRMEAYEFTEINRSVSAGFSLKGGAWSREADTFGAAAVINGLSRPARSYFSAGGMGILIGDGALRYRPERIAELYYLASINRHIAVSVDVQHILDPAYNADRGPVTVYGLRLHAEF